MNRPRLLHLISILEQVNSEDYDQSHWHCGTTACAGGHAAMDPLFQAEGLSQTSTGAPLYAGYDAFDALSRFFDLSYAQTSYIFGSTTYEDLAEEIAGDSRDDYAILDQLIAATILPHHVIARIKELLA